MASFSRAASDVRRLKPTRRPFAILSPAQLLYAVLSLADTLDAFQARRDVTGHHIVTVLSLVADLRDLLAHLVLNRANPDLDGRNGRCYRVHPLDDASPIPLDGSDGEA
jgi:hypothetical protein